MKVLIFLNDFLPYPSVAGGLVMTWALTRELLEQGHEPIICRFGSGSDTDYPWLPKARAKLTDLGIKIFELKTFPAPKKTRFFRIRSALFPRQGDFYPYWVSDEDISRIIKLVKPDVLYLFTAKSVALLDGYHGIIPKATSIIDLDPELLAVRRRFRPDHSRLSRLWNQMDRLSARSVGRFLVEMLRGCDLVFEHAAHHAEWLRSNKVPCVYVPNPVEDPYAGRSLPQWGRPPGGPKIKISLIGNAGGISTWAGLTYLTEAVLPFLPPVLLDKIEIHIIGGGRFPPGFLDRVKVFPQVKMRGYVEDICAEFETMDMIFVPTPISLGFRTRIAHAFGFGAVVVAHKANAAGMPELKHLENCWLCDEPQDFWTAVVALRDDIELRRKIATGARSTFERHYSSRVVCRTMIEELARLVARPQTFEPRHLLSV